MTKTLKASAGIVWDRFSDPVGGRQAALAAGPGQRPGPTHQAAQNPPALRFFYVAQAGGFAAESAQVVKFGSADF